MRAYFCNAVSLNYNGSMGLKTKKDFFEDSLEKITQVGTGIVTQGAKAVDQTANPVSWVQSLYGIPESTASNPNDKPENKSMQNLEKGDHNIPNHTPLDKQRLEEKYREQDMASLAEARRQFKWFQNQEQEYLAKKKREEQQQEHQERQQEEKKRKMEEERRKKQSEGDYEARGKQKQRLGQPRRKATTELHPETKAGGAK
jgi:hypothetical protein